MKYVIQWTSKIDGRTHLGKKELSLETAEQWVLDLNERFKDITHEVVPLAKKLQLQDK